MYQVRFVQATVTTQSSILPNLNCYGVVTPNEQVLAADKCDFEEKLWKGGKEIAIPLTNWGDQPILIKKQSHIGKIDQAELVT